MSIERNDFSEETEESVVGKDFPPETSKFLSWSALRFIRAPSSVALLWTVYGISITLACLLLLTRYIEKDVFVQSQGEIISDLGSREVIASAQGEVNEVRKKVGDLISQDEVIATLFFDKTSELSLKTIKTKLRVLEDQLKTNQSAEFLDLKFSMDNIQELNLGIVSENLFSLEQLIRTFRETKYRYFDGNDSEIKALKNKLSVLKGKQSKLERSKQRHLLEVYLESLKEEQSKIKLQIQAMIADANLKLEQEKANVLKATRTSISGLNDFLNNKQIRSPMNGIISKLYVKKDGFIQAGKPVALISPSESKFMTANYLFSKDISNISENKKVLYKVEAYPYQTYGVFVGSVISIEQTKDTNKPEAIALGDYVVYATIELPENVRDDLRPNIHIISGMKFSSTIIVERKPISEIIKDRLFSHL